MRGTSLIVLSILLDGTSGLNILAEKPIKAAKTPKTPVAEAGPVFYTVIMGRLAYRHQVSLWLSSLRLLGKWTKEVVIVTDNPVCLATTLTEAKLLGAKIISTYEHDIYGPAEGYTGNVHLVKRPQGASINKMKLEKARAWLNVHVAGIPHQVSSIIYTDEDIVIGKDVASFVHVIRELEVQSTPNTLALFRDTGKSAGELHTGVVAMFPGTATDGCLQAWGKKLTGVSIGSDQAALYLGGIKEQEMTDEHEKVDIQEDAVLAEEHLAMGPDQEALGRTKECKSSAGLSAGVKILPKQFFWFPTPQGLHAVRQAEFVHFTNTGRWKIISHDTIRTYLKKIGIPEHIDPTGNVQDKSCAIPEGGTIKDVIEGPKNYGR